MAAVDGRVPLAWGIGTRDGSMSKDSKTGNMVLQNTDSGLWRQKRPGLQIWQQSAAGPGQGLFIYNELLYSISGFGSLSLITPVTGGFPSGASIPLSTGLGFYKAVNPGVSGPAYFTDNIRLYQFNGTASVVGGGSPLNTVSGLAVLDGTMYMMNKSTIFASAYNDPTTWPGLNTVGLNTAYGAGVAIVSHMAYIVAFMELGTQFFYDAGISPGAPIAQVQNGAISIGCANGDSIAAYEDVLYFLGRDIDATMFIGSFNGLTFSRVSSNAIDKILETSIFFNPNSKGAMNGFTTVAHGRPLYVLNAIAAGVTLVYDILGDLWDYWSTVVGGVEQIFNGVCLLSSTTLNYSFVQGVTDGIVYILNPLYMSDNLQPINCFIRTPPGSSGTYAVKFCAAAYLHADTAPTTVSVTYSNDDYQTFAVSRTIDLSTQKKMLVRCGSYRHRSWDLKHTDITSSFRVGMLETDLVDTGEGNQ